MQKRSLLTSLLLLASPVMADPSDQHIGVGTRPFSHEEQALIQESRAQEITIAQNGVPHYSSLLLNVSNPKETICIIPLNSHLINHITDKYDAVELEDKSGWKIDPGYSHVVRSWRKSDVIVITPNHRPFSHYNYFISNQNTNSYALANLIVGPAPFGEYSHWIIGIDEIHGNIYLDNNTSWNIDPRDRYLLKKWKINDGIIMGVNDRSWMSFDWISSYETILINVQTNNYIRAKQF